MYKDYLQSDSGEHTKNNEGKEEFPIVALDYRKVYIHTLGCPKNEVDSEMWGILFKKKGYRKVKKPIDADIILVNTCSFIDDAIQESVEHILEMVDYKNSRHNRKVFVAGCLAQQHGEELLNELPEIDGALGNTDITASFNYLEKKLASNERFFFSSPQNSLWYHDEDFSMPESFPYAYLKIAEGCDNYCSYCVIPFIRGHFRSLPREMAIAQAQRLVEKGFKEIVIVGQDTTKYGEDLYPDYRLHNLIRDIHEIPGDFLIRLLYAYPTRITPDLLDALSLPKVARYLDVPIQHISDKVLESMGRPMTGDVIREMTATIHERLPGIALRTSLIVGFPTETDDDFAELLHFVDEGHFLHIGVFAYSPQEGTPAFSSLTPLDSELVNYRKELIELAHREIYIRENQKLVGQQLMVIIDRPAFRDGFHWGRPLLDAPEIDRKIKLYGEAEPGEIRSALVLKGYDYQILGVLL